MGPERGVDLGGLSLIFPECKISLPRLRFTRFSHFLREGHMELDSARAPYVENPYLAQAALLQRQAQEQQQTPREAEPTPRDADQNPQQAPREAQPNPQQAPPSKYAPPYQHAGQGQGFDRGSEERLDRIERALEMQMQAMNECMKQLQHMRQMQSQAQYEPLPVPAQGPKQAIPRPKVPPDYGQLRPLPSIEPNGSGVAKASYLRPTAEPSLAAPPIREPRPAR